MLVALGVQAAMQGTRKEPMTVTSSLFDCVNVS